jgi:hypothetical protein
MDTTTTHSYNVTYTGDFFTLTTTVTEVPGEGRLGKENALALASDNLLWYYGWNVRDAASIDIEIDRID